MTHAAPAAGHAMSWIVVTTHPRKERLAVEGIEGQKFVGYCPMLAKRIRHARRSALVSRPMFPSHVLAGLAAGGARWRPILSTCGVRTVLRSGERPGFLPAGFVEALRACEVDGRIVAPCPPCCAGRRGTEPAADHGALIAAMLEMNEQERLLALVGLLAPVADAKVGFGAGA
jgi:transcriptional antiterminator RfaH